MMLMHAVQTENEVPIWVDSYPIGVYVITRQNVMVVLCDGKLKGYKGEDNDGMKEKASQSSTI
jgi:hypothetical protein